MSHNKPTEHWKREANAHTRRTMLFNERTDRSLHVELSQLERNRKEIVRDLRKIKQVKGALKKQLSSALEASSRPRRRSRSDTSIDAYSSHTLLPNIAPNAGRSRLQSDVGPVDRLLKNDLIASDRLLKTDRVATDKLPGTSDKTLEFSGRGEDNRNADQAQALGEGNLFQEKSKQNQSEFTYKTNQERREDHMIKSRFNQLGSKYVGRQMVGRKSSKASNKLPKVQTQNRAKQSSQAKETIRDSDNEIGAKQSGDGERDFPAAAAQDSLSSEMATLEINNNRREATTIETDGTLSDPLVRYIPDIRIQPHLWPEETLAITCQKPEEQTHPVTNKDGSNSMLGTSKALQRKISTCSLVCSQQMLPKIPMELTSKRQSRGSVCLERAFVDCQEVRAGNMDLKTERKRRFARLVDMVIKQKKVIRAWEPMLALVGDIHSSDDEA